jgi:hypothetical protein
MDRADRDIQYIFKCIESMKNWVIGGMVSLIMCLIGVAVNLIVTLSGKHP